MIEPTIGTKNIKINSMILSEVLSPKSLLKISIRARIMKINGAKAATAKIRRIIPSCAPMFTNNKGFVILQLD